MNLPLTLDGKPVTLDGEPVSLDENRLNLDGAPPRRETHGRAKTWRIPPGEKLPEGFEWPLDKQGGGS